MVDPTGTIRSQLPAPGTSSLGAGAKEEKAVKETRKMFKEIGRVSSKVKGMPGAFGAIGVGIESVMPFLETLAPLFQAFAPILTIVNAGFSAFAGAITAELVPALQPFFIALIGMIPLFTELGTIVGQMIVIGLIPLIALFIPLIEIFVSLTTIFLQFIGFEGVIIAVIAVVVILGIAFFALISPLLPIIAIVTAITLVIIFLVAIIRDNWVPIMEFISNVMIGVGTVFIAIGTAIYNFFAPALQFVWTIFSAIGGFIYSIFVPALQFVWTIFNVIGSFIYSIFVPAIFALALGIAFLIDAFTLGLAGAVNWVHANVPSYQMGIARVPETGLAMVHKDERITPAGEVGLEVGLLEEIRDLQREQLEEIKWRTR